MSREESARPRVTVEITGGLGNQLFQYAAARALALRLGAALSVDRSFYRRGRHRSFTLDQFPIVVDGIEGGLLAGLRQRLAGPVPAYEEPHIQPDRRFFDLRAPVRIKGYFQSEDYFVDHTDVIRAELAVPQAGDRESLDLAERLAGGNAASLHVRRGDYVASPANRRRYDVCGMDYYQRALARLPPDCPVIVFSDEPSWAEANLPRVRPLVFVGQAGPRTDLQDLWLMAQMRHHIIANSTFSWWGAWLGEHDDGLVLAPQRWFGEPELDASRLVPERWQRIAN